MDANKAFTLIQALRDLTTETGTITTRSQNNILRMLSDDDLTRVAAMLKHHTTIQNILAGKKSKSEDANV